MTAPRTADEVHAEHVAMGTAAVAQAQQANTQQQAGAGRWLDASVPANPNVHSPGPEQD